jgi:DNA mismatch repair protein MutS
VPAELVTIGPIDRIFTRIGASDDLSNAKSTFMVEMTETANILNNATPNSLIIMDEIGRGTSTFDGLALAHAILKFLVEHNKSFCLFATHYFELTKLAQKYNTIKNVHLYATEYQDKIVFLHHVKDGHATKSYGIQVAKLAGIPKIVLDSAKKHLKKLEENQKSASSNLEVDLFNDPLSKEDEFSPSLSITLIEKKSEKDDNLAPPITLCEKTILSELKNLIPDELTPKEALALLYKLVEQINADSISPSRPQ